MKTSSQERIKKLTDSGDWGSKTLHSLLAHWADVQPNGLAVIDQPDREVLTGEKPKRVNWRELELLSDAFANQLTTLGVKANDTVIIQLPNIVELVVCYFALSKLGAVCSPLPVQYGAHEINLAASTLRPSLFITIREFKGTPLATQARASLQHTPVVCVGEDLLLDTDLDTLRPQRTATPDEANQILTVVWTSGTTGTPKGVPRSHNMWLATGAASASAGAISHEDRLLCPFPLVNMAAIGGLLIPALIHGCCLTLHHPLDPAILMRQLKEESITYTVIPPAMLNQLAKNPQSWHQLGIESIRALASGSAPLAPWMIKTFRDELGIEIINMYGSNEGIALYATPQNAPDPETRATKFKRPESSAFFATKVIDVDSGKTLHKHGERGELLVSGATVFDGYLDYDNQHVFDADGFFRTGDLVEISGNESDYFQIVGRCKDIINRGGMKISPVEIDLLLEGYPDALEAAVCSYPDERLSEKICACLVIKDGSAVPTLDDLQAWLLDKGLAKFKLPERVETFEALPRNAIGKVQRFKLMGLLQ